MAKKWLPLIARYLLGLAVLVFGLMGALRPKEEFVGAGADLINAIFNSGYIFEIQTTVLILTGVALLVNRFVPLSLILLAPFTLNWLLFHLIVNLENTMPSVVVIVLQAYLMYDNWPSFSHLFKPKVSKKK